MKQRLSHLLVPCVCSCLLVLGVVSSAGAGAAPTRNTQLAQIRAFLTAKVQTNRLPGLAFGLVHDKEIVSLQSFGEASEGHPVTPHTPFLLDSLTKSFTALAVMQEVEAGHLALDAPVQRYLPWFRLADLAASAQITVRHLLTMSSGLSAASPPITTTETMEQFVRSLSTVAPDRPVGSRFEYAPSGYVILGLLVQTVSGQAYGSYLEQHILAPLQMEDSFVAFQAAAQHGLAQGNQWLFGVPLPADDVALHQPATLPSGGLFSSVEDMTHYLIAQLNGGRYGSAMVLSPSGIAAMHTPAVPNPTTGDPFGPDTFYGMGWHLGTIAGVPTLWHDGVSVAYHTFMLLEPQNHWGAVLLVNANTHIPSAANGNTFFYDLYAGLARLLAGQTPPPTGLSLSTFYDFADGLMLWLAALALWWLLRVPRWYQRFRQRPHARRVVVRIGGELLLPVGLFLGFPLVVGSWSDLLYTYPDLGWWLVVTLAVLLVTGISRGGLALLVPRRKGATTGQASAHPPRTSSTELGGS